MRDLKQNASLTHIQQNIQTSSLKLFASSISMEISMKPKHCSLNMFQWMRVRKQIVNIHVILLLTTHNQIASRSLLVFVAIFCAPAMCVFFWFMLLNITRAIAFAFHLFTIKIWASKVCAIVRVEDPNRQWSLHNLSCFFYHMKCANEFQYTSKVMETYELAISWREIDDKSFNCFLLFKNVSFWSFFGYSKLLNKQCRRFNCSREKIAHHSSSTVKT